LVEDSLRTGDQLGHVVERLERRAAKRVGRGVPRAHRLDAERVASFGVQFGEQRHHFLLDGVVKCEAVIRRVVEATLAAMGEVAVIRKAGVGAHLVAPLGQVVELGVDGFGLFETSVGGESPRFLPPGAVGFF